MYLILFVSLEEILNERIDKIFKIFNINYYISLIVFDEMLNRYKLKMTFFFFIISKFWILSIPFNFFLSKIIVNVNKFLLQMVIFVSIYKRLFLNNNTLFLIINKKKKIIFYSDI